MKKILIIFSLIGAMFIYSCSDSILDTVPTESVSGTDIFSDAENALVAVNGIYRLMYTGSWGSGWEPENGGLPAFILAMDLLAEDHVMDGAGSGWFWYDYVFDNWGDFSHNAGRQYQMWNFFYTLISNANYILVHDGVIEGDEDMANYVMGQAYAIRSYAYMNLVQSYQQNDPTKPGVPIYTEPTVVGTEGQPRGTVQNVYDLANDDIDKAIEYLENSSVTQMHKSHIDKYVAYGLKARYALVQQDFETALAAAEEALKSPASIVPFENTRYVNNIDAANAMWGLGIQTDQAMGSWDIFSHMDADSESTYSQARHLISSWLYTRIPETDARRAWWTSPVLPDGEEWGEAGTTNGSFSPYVQTKLVYSNVSASEGDHILMRKEEIALMAAEAACHLERFTEARNYVSMVGTMRDSDYETRLAGFVNSKVYNQSTTGDMTTLMDEILFQRRVELWSEIPRIHDLQRLGLGFTRGFDGSNHPSSARAANVNTAPASPAFILWIPQAEFDGNENMDATKDQNPSQRG